MSERAERCGEWSAPNPEVGERYEEFLLRCMRSLESHVNKLLGEFAPRDKRVADGGDQSEEGPKAGTKARPQGWAV